MARVTMSVSDSLKKRMGKVKRHVNWSEVAQAAFERKLGELGQQKEIKKMSDVIERLRASKLESDSETGKQGRSDGRKWAMRTAEAFELEMLATYRRSCEDACWDLTFNPDDPDTVNSPGVKFYDLILRDRSNYSFIQATEFWDDRLGDRREAQNDGAYVMAFAEGALEVWNEVSDKI
ncbi:MAG: hypothetical protein IID33_18265 [Planctomycetes bacterium]|nr:hypothetical protein [Planctomycetota bacterium]